MPRPFDRTPLTDAHREVAAGLFLLARRRAARVAARFPRLADEIESVAGLAAVQAARNFEDRGIATLETFGWRRINGAILRVLITEARRRAEMTPEPDNWPRPGRSFAKVEPRDHVAEIDARDEAMALLGRLPVKQAAVLWLLHLEGRSQDEVAWQLGWSQSLVSSLARRGCRALAAST
jgi:RNA polymerase sigma factor (sigma-70 family)